MNKSKLNELLRYAWLEGRTNGLQNNGKSFSEFLELKEVSEAINYTHSCKSDSEQLKNKIMSKEQNTKDKDKALHIGGVSVSFLYDFVNEFTDTEMPKEAIKETLDKLNER
jgi:hypothetical protein